MQATNDLMTQKFINSSKWREFIIGLSQIFSSHSWASSDLTRLLSGSVPEFVDTYTNIWGLANIHDLQNALNIESFAMGDPLNPERAILHWSRKSYTRLETSLWMDQVRYKHKFGFKSGGFEYEMCLTYFYNEPGVGPVLKQFGRFPVASFDETTTHFGRAKSPLAPKYYHSDGSTRTIEQDGYILSAYYKSSIRDKNSRVFDRNFFKEDLDSRFNNYINPKDAQAKLLRRLGIPMLYVCKDSDYAAILKKCETIGHTVPLLTETQFRLLQAVLKMDDTVVNFDGVSKTISELTYREVVENLADLVAQDSVSQQFKTAGVGWYLQLFANQVTKMFHECPDFWIFSDYDAITTRWDEIDGNPESIDWHQDLMSLYYFIFIKNKYILSNERNLLASAKELLKDWFAGTIHIPAEYTML